jgi:hypothetical protein
MGLFRFYFSFLHFVFDVLNNKPGTRNLKLQRVINIWATGRCPRQLGSVLVHWWSATN